MPQLVTFFAGLILPPRLLAPPPLPIPPIILQPFPILNMLTVYFQMFLPQMRAYFLLQTLYLFINYDLQPILHNTPQDFAWFAMSHQNRGLKCLFTSMAFSLICVDFFFQLKTYVQFIKYSPTKWTLLLSIRPHPFFYTIDPKNMPIITPAVDSIRIGHKLQTNRTDQLLLNRFPLNQWTINTLFYIITHYSL